MRRRIQGSRTAANVALFLITCGLIAADSRAESGQDRRNSKPIPSKSLSHEQAVADRAHDVTGAQNLAENEARLYQAVSSDLKSGKPLIITTFVNLQYNGGRPPLAVNMYWGGGYGYFSFFDRGVRNKMYKRRFGALTFRRVLLAEQKKDPIRTAVFKADFVPGGRLSSLGDRQAELILVNLAWKNGWNGLIAAVRAATEGTGNFRIVTDDGATIDPVQDARIVGFAGHNPRFDTTATVSLKRINTSDRILGVFAAGCMTAGPPDVRLTPFLATKNTIPLLFTRGYVSAEAYSFLGMVSAFIQGRSLLEIAESANDEYQAFQRHHNGRGGRPFLAPNRIRIPKRPPPETPR